MKPLRTAFWVLAGAAAICSGAPASAQRDAGGVLQELRQASGGGAWDTTEAIVATGTKQSFGLSGRYSSIETLGAGFFKRSADYGLLRNAEGLDSSGRWRMENSGGLHPLDSDEARTVARTEAYLAARGYFFPDRNPASFALEPAASKDGHQFDRIEATPAGGRTVELWIDRSDHLLHRVVIQLATVTETIDYRDYRRSGALVLPFEIVTDNGDQPETGVARINDYRVTSASAAQSLLQRPAAPTDSTIHSATGRTVARFSLDKDSGFPIIWASINGGEALPFILDTGGHDIVTPVAARNLGLTIVGRGFSLGAGAGSMATQFTKVQRLSIGEADIVQTPFTVLDIDLGETTDGQGRRARIAGLLGLELFERFRVVLKSDGQAVLEDPSLSPGGDYAVSMPISFTRDMPLIEASLAGHRGTFAFDTGNNTGLIVSPGWAKQTGVSALFAGRPATGGESVGGPLSLRSGVKLPLSAGSLSIGPIDSTLSGENMGSLSSRSEAGNIGLAPFAGFDVVIDYPHGLIMLRKRGN
jgi:hypothetical protein